MIQSISNFTYELYIPEDDQFGLRDEKTGLWNGMIREVIDKKADFGFVLTVTAERENVVDFTVPIHDNMGISILMLKPKKEISILQYFTVFEPKLWFSIILAYFVTSFLIWFLNKLSPYSYQNDRNRDSTQKSELSSFNDCLWLCFKSLTPQGPGKVPQNLSGRIIIAGWWIFGFLILASYSINLAAMLTELNSPPAISSLDDLVKQSNIRFSSVVWSPARQYFKKMAEIEQMFHS